MINFARLLVSQSVSDHKATWLSG